VERKREGPHVPHFTPALSPPVGRRGGGRTGTFPFNPPPPRVRGGGERSVLDESACAPMTTPSSRHSTGLLPSQEIRKLIADGVVTGDRPIDDEQIQPASLDLRLGPVAYRIRASFLPGSRNTVAEKMANFTMHEIDLTGGAVLEKGCVYLVPVMERLALKRRITALANPKSSTGRLDIFTRLITDRATEFERVPEGYAGPLYAEISPRTFSVLVRMGTRLSQLRFRRGAPSATDAAMRRLHASEPLVQTEDQNAVIERGVAISVDLGSAGNDTPIGYRAKKHADLIDLAKIAHYDRRDFWEPLTPSPRGLVLNPDDFYILASKESVSVPPDHAAEMVPYDPWTGEFRVHYAGFFDPGFGHRAGGGQGTRAVLEVRSHDVPFVIEDGQIVGRLIYERLTELPEKLYGTGIGSSYQRQGLTLSKQFRSD